MQSTEASRWARSAWRWLRLSAPVDVDSIANRFGCPMTPDPELPDGVGGMFVCTPYGVGILFNPNLSLEEQRHVKAHEAYHFLRYRKRVGRSTVVRFKLNEDLEEEEAAERFAIELILPAWLVTAGVLSYAKLEPEVSLPIMAAQFGCTQATLEMRITELDLEEYVWEKRPLIAALKRPQRLYAESIPTFAHMR